MTAQKCKKKCQQKIFCIFECLFSFPKTHLIQSLNSLGSSRPYESLLENQKTVGSKELFLPKNGLPNSPQKFFQKNIQISEAWKPTEDMKFRLFAHALLHMNSI